MQPPICMNSIHEEKEMTPNNAKGMFVCSICGMSMDYKDYIENLRLGENDGKIYRIR